MGCLMSWFQSYCTVQLEDRAIILLLEKPENVKDEVMVDYQPEKSDPDNKPVIQEEEKVDSNAEYANIELPCIRTYKQSTIPCQMEDQIQDVHAA